MKTFRLPRDPVDRNRWIAIILKYDTPNEKGTMVCERYWPVSYVTVWDYGKLQLCDPHSQFDCAKAILIKIVLSTPKRAKKGWARANASNDLAIFLKRDKVDNSNNIQGKFNLLSLL